MSRRPGIVTALAVMAALVFTVSRLLDWSLGARTATTQAIQDPRLAAQIQAVMDSMDRTGEPPAGVAQGGRRNGARGVFDNAEGRLPAQPRGYYTETDVWPRGGSGRGAERLIFGRSREVYYTADHYRTFIRVR
jgi:guanyl-specific ribonuclease Sa